MHNKYPTLHIRLREARQMLQLSMQDLSDRTGGLVSKQSISYYEQGRSSPKRQALTSLAHALGISEAYFLGESSIDTPALRTSVGDVPLSADEQSAIEARIVFWAERYATLECSADIQPPPFLPPIAPRLVATPDDAVQAAADVRRAWDMGTGPVPGILRLFERKGIGVMSDSLPQDVWGLSTWTSAHRPLVIVDMHEEKTTVERLRFTAAHELAHLLFTFPDDMEQRQREKLCNKFAGVFILPSETLIEELGRHRRRLSLGELIDLKELYGVSVSALVHTAYDLSIIDSQTYNWWYDEQINKNRKETGWGHYAFPETIGREKRLKSIVADSESAPQTTDNNNI